MSTKPLLLLVGHDSVLNRTRSLILQNVFTVRVAQHLSEAVSLMSGQRFDLVLLCYSLSEPDAQAVVTLVHELSAGTRILALAQVHERLRLLVPDEEFLLGAPEELLRKAASMIGIQLPRESHPRPEQPSWMQRD
jgi:CheY-like chemotaxis protein